MKDVTETDIIFALQNENIYLSTRNRNLNTLYEASIKAGINLVQTLRETQEKSKTDRNMYMIGGFFIGCLVGVAFTFCARFL